MKITYYELLTMMKDGNIPKKIIRHIYKSSEVYFYSEDDRCYLLKDESKQNQNFKPYLNETFTDMGMITDREIEVLK